MKVGVCLTTYNPDIKLLKKVIASLKDQVNAIYVADNGSKNLASVKKLLSGEPFVILDSLGFNTGIGHSTNVGLQYFMDKKFDFAVLSDQDTVYDSDFIKTFKTDLKEVNEAFDNSIAYAPVFFDKTRNCIPPMRVKTKLYMKKVNITEKYTKIFETIASGLIIDLRKLPKVGLMNEELFIDWVDLEWCWKVNKLGYQIVACKNLVMNHQIGDSIKNLGFKKITMHSSARQYFIIRNCMYLSLNCMYLSWLHREIMYLKSYVYFIRYCLLDRNGKKLYRKALKDGIKSKLGPLEQQGV